MGSEPELTKDVTNSISDSSSHISTDDSQIFEDTRQILTHHNSSSTPETNIQREIIIIGQTNNNTDTNLPIPIVQNPESYVIDVPLTPSLDPNKNLIKKTINESILGSNNCKLVLNRYVPILDEMFLNDTTKKIEPGPQRFEVYMEKQVPESTKSPSQSDGPSVYFDALETIEPKEASPSQGSQQSQSNLSWHYNMKYPIRRQSRIKNWCCCCCQSRAIAPSSGSFSYRVVKGPTVEEQIEKSKVRSTFFCGSTSVRTSCSEQITSNVADISSGDLDTHVHLSKQVRRKRIQDRPNLSMSLWSVLKNALSKDISRTPLPVNFSEPLSMLQRLAEDYDYSYILDKAAVSTDQYLQICQVAAFGVASYANTAIRTWKPFNPIMGETYEWDRMEDLGWRYISEQVSHHPPTAATHCESTAGWVCWQDLTMHSHWHMNTCDFDPTGITHLKFTESGHHYTWRKVSTIVHNLIMGKLWVDQVGDMVIINHKTGDTCKLQFIPSYGKEQKQVKGAVSDSTGQMKWTLSGTWDEEFYATSVSSQTNKSEPKLIEVLWKSKPPVPGADKYYNMTEFACQLNEMEFGIAPTDSRFRPDQRLMEECLWDAANLEKVRLEEKQRNSEKRWERGEEDMKSVDVLSVQSRQIYTPLWFQKGMDEIIPKTSSYKYTEKYWEQKKMKLWNMCPKIY